MNLERYEGAWNEGLLGPSFLTALLEIFAQVRQSPGTKTSEWRSMFPSHFSVNDFGVFAVVLVFGLIVILLFTFDFVSMLNKWQVHFAMQINSSKQ